MHLLGVQALLEIFTSQIATYPSRKKRKNCFQLNELGDKSKGSLSPQRLSSNLEDERKLDDLPSSEKLTNRIINALDVSKQYQAQRESCTVDPLPGSVKKPVMAVTELSCELGAGWYFYFQSRESRKALSHS